MPYIETRDDLTWYRENFTDVWQSAELTVSCVEVPDGFIPQGELRISREPADPTREVRYSEGAVSIQRIVSEEPFELVEAILEGNLPTTEGTATIQSGLHEHNPGTFFQTAVQESLVRETRPQLEVNAAIDVELSDETQAEYLDVVDELEPVLRTAEEPYYDLGRCEGYYFEHIFRVDREAPKILVFADSGLAFEIDDDQKLQLTAPDPLFEHLSLSVLPQQPYDEHQGWRIVPDSDDTTAGEASVSEFQRELALDGITKLYVLLYIGDRMLSLFEHQPGDQIPENPRFEVMRTFDQDEKLAEYVTGSEPNQFETAVANVMSTAGWIVQQYGDSNFNIPNFSPDVPGAQYQEIDVVAYNPDNTTILCIECTNNDVSNKTQIVDRTEAIKASLERYTVPTGPGLVTHLSVVPCVATPQSKDEISGDIQDDFQEKGIEILDGDRLQSIYAASMETAETVEIDQVFVEGI